jgi:uncharacterized protein YfaS (alpha-2-macroglobulin family)
MAFLKSPLFARYRIPILVTLLLLILSAVMIGVLYRSLSGSAGRSVPIGSSALMEGGDSTMENISAPVPIGLSEGQPQPQAFEPLPVQAGEPLSEEQIQQILARVSDLALEPEDQVDFQIALDPIPPPLTGDTIEETFPPKPEPLEPGVVATGPLQVLRYGPEGEISIAPFVNIIFNQPMVPVATLEELTAEQVPVRLEPALPGTWRWLGVKTLTFQYDSELIDRLPKATEYRVTIPAGTRSMSGGILTEAVEWTFTTPPVQVVEKYPDNHDQPQPLDALIFIAFDQRIDPVEVLDTVEVFAGPKLVEVKLAEEADIKAHQEISHLVKSFPEGRWLAFKPSESLPADTDISVKIGPGTPSAEGPLLTEEAISFGFQTYAPLQIETHGCAWSESPCQPLTPLMIKFNNPIDLSAYQESNISISPEIPGASVNIFSSRIEIQGATRGQTTYTALVSGDIQDIFGQKLGQDVRLTFRIGPAQPVLMGPDKNFITLDPAAQKPVFSVYTINYTRLDVQIYAVQPSDWLDFRLYLREFGRQDAPPQIPGNLVFDRSLPVEAAADELTEVAIDLSSVMDGEFGHFIVIVKPPKELFKEYEYWRIVQAWVQVTQIGLDAYSDHSDIIAWTTSLTDGASLSDVTISSGPGKTDILTGEDGLARFPIPNGASYLVAKKGADQAILPKSQYYWGEDAWMSRTVNDELRWYVFDDRQMYRPGEDVHIKGWLRRLGGKQDGDVGLVGGAVQSVRYQIIEPQGNEIGSGWLDVNALGGFDFVFTIPEKVNLGYAQVVFDADLSLGELTGLQYYHNFQIQEFRRPEFEVTARTESEGPYFAAEEGVVAVEAKYYAGGPLPGAEVTWNVASTPSTYKPPNWPEFTFGIWTPWWFFGRYAEWDYYGSTGETTYETFTSQTDSGGSHYLRLDFPERTDHQPYTVQAEATVMDVNRQAWTGATNLLVHPANLYVGLRSEQVFVERGTPLKVDVIITDLDGNPVIDRLVEVQAARMEWKYRGEWVEEEVDPQTCRIGSALEPVTCTFETPLGGKYTITAEVTDGLGRVNRTQFTRWVSGGQRPPARNVEQEEVILIPNQETYKPGDVAQILVQSPFSPAEGLLTVSRSGILYSERFRIEEGTVTLNVPIMENHIPNLHVQVDLNGAATRLDDLGEPLSELPPRPAYATGQLNLSIPPLQRSLSLQATPRETELEPGSETMIDLRLTDVAGEPVFGAELAVVVVDEAILSLTNYRLTDPLSIFYADRPADLSSQYGRASIVLTDPQALLDTAMGGMMERGIAEEELAVEAPMPAMEPQADSAEGMAKSTSAAAPIRVRTDFNPLAVFAPSVRTNAQGEASVEVKLPDNLTRYRVMVVAVDEGNQFGIGEANLVARLPLMVRPSAPRFLNFGDRFELPVVLQNQTREPMLVDVVVQASNLVLTGNAGLRVEVPARDRVEVRFPVATDRAGIARLQVVAVSGDFADAAQAELPVYTPATTEAFATYGVVDEGAIAQPVAAPEGVFPQYGGLEINTSSTALHSLTDAVLYLVSYPYDCAEQLASRILAVAALRDVLTAFQAEGMPTPEEMEAAVRRDIERLRVLQNPDGGYPYWWYGADSIPFNSIHVAHALARAELKGFDVPEETQQLLLEHLRQIENYYPHWYGRETRWTLSAYALYVRDLMGDADPMKAMNLLDEAGLEQLSLDAIGWPKAMSPPLWLA